MVNYNSESIESIFFVVLIVLRICVSPSIFARLFAVFFVVLLASRQSNNDSRVLSEPSDIESFVSDLIVVSYVFFTTNTTNVGVTKLRSPTEEIKCCLPNTITPL